MTRRKALAEHYKVLDEVICLCEAARQYKYPKQALSLAIDLGQIAAIRSGRNVIISKASIDKWFKDKRQFILN